jgi:hypothetical protein
MSETARAHILKIMENYADVEEWRAKQEDPGDLNHPSRVWDQVPALGQADHRARRDVKSLPITCPSPPLGQVPFKEMPIASA